MYEPLMLLISVLSLDLVNFRLVLFSSEEIIQQWAMSFHYQSFNTDIAQHVVDYLEHFVFQDSCQILKSG